MLDVCKYAFSHANIMNMYKQNDCVERHFKGVFVPTRPQDTDWPRIKRMGHTACLWIPKFCT